MRKTIFVLLSLPIWLIGLLLLAYAALTWFLTGKSAQVLAWMVSLDQLGNTIAFGDPDETISSRAGKCARKGGNKPCYWICQFLNWIDPRHCDRHIEEDEGRRDI